MIATRLLKYPVVLLLGFIIAGCSDDTFRVSEKRLNKNLVSAELVLPASYELPHGVPELRSELDSDNVNKWELPATQLGMTIRLTNIATRPVKIAYPSGCYTIDFDLDGAGAKEIWAPNSIHFTGPSMGSARQLDPGESFVISMKEMNLPQRNYSWRGFLTESGVVKIRAIYQAKCLAEGYDAVYANTGWQNLKVVETR